MKHDEYTIFKKEVDNFIIRYMCAYNNLWSKEYKNTHGSLGNVQTPKKYLVIKYPKNKDKDVPRKKGEGKNRGQWMNNWTKHWWYDKSEDAKNKYNSL